MKTRILILLFVAFSIIVNAQKKPSQWSQATKDSMELALGYVKTEDVDSAAYYTDSQIDSLFRTNNDGYLNKVLEGLGSGFVIRPVNYYMSGTRTSHTIVDGRLIMVAVYIPDTITLTGVKWGQYTAGDYTGDNTNGFALYSVSGTTYTKVAETTNDSEIWKQTSTTTGTKAFSSTYEAAPGVYYIAWLYNSSAQTTAPVLYMIDMLAREYSMVTGTTNNLCQSYNGQTSFSSSLSASSFASYTEAVMVWLY